MFEQKKAVIERAGIQLQQLPVERACLGRLVLGGLRCVYRQAGTFDACVTDDMPFAKHFFNELASLPQDDGSHWISLLEDLALLFRVRQLAFPQIPESEDEAEVREFFESSGEWDSGTLVGAWYWKILPARLAS